uniref:Predicted protein n=1 Tax=Hordeum vulgare subsp. vulgare TaxID=112509 RepID=F2EHV2_HORVV|nr:predicted protein [Hordeum vulgare subsp. vulgare]
MPVPMTSSESLIDYLTNYWPATCMIRALSLGKNKESIAMYLHISALLLNCHTCNAVSTHCM